LPALTIVIDTPERIQTAFDIIDDLTAEHGLVTCETVPAIRPVGDGHATTVSRLARYAYCDKETTVLRQGRIELPTASLRSRSCGALQPGHDWTGQ